MPNPFRNASMSQAPQMQNLKSMYNMLVNSKNPMQLFQQMAANNPQMRPILQALKQGMNPQQIFSEMCKQRNINPDEFMKQITG